MLTESALSGIPDMAYRLRLGDDNKITWHATIDGKQVIETKEPQTSGWRRFRRGFSRLHLRNNSEPERLSVDDRRPSKSHA